MTFVEPTRRLTFSPRFSYDGRYGAALVAVLLGGYLMLTTNVGQLALAFSGRANFPPEQTVFLFLQYAFAVAVVLAGLAIAPATSGRRVIAVVVALVLILLWTILFSARITGTAGPLPFATGFFTWPSLIVPLAAATGWLIVRERSAISYLALLLAFLGGLIPFLLVLNGASGIVTQLIVPAVAGVIGVGIAWIARAIHGAIGRMHDHDPYVDAPPAV